MINDNNSKENNQLYENDLCILSQLINELEALNMDIVLLGDFNTDQHRKSRNSRSLRDFLDKTITEYVPHTI